MTPDLNELERLLKDYEESTRRLGQSNFCNQSENLSKAIYAEQRVKTAAVNALPGLIERVRELEKRANVAEGLVERMIDFAEIHNLYSFENEFSGAKDLLQTLCPADTSKLTIRS